MAFEVQHQVDLPVGTLLRAVLQSLEVKEIPYADRKTGEAKTFTKLVWLFEVTQAGDYLGKTVRAETSAFLSDSPYNQFRSWAEALLNRPLSQGQVLNEADLIGLPALITVKYEADRKDESRKFPRVEDVISIGDPGSTFAFDEPPF